MNPHQKPQEDVVEGEWPTDEYGLAAGDLHWNIPANIRWLAGQFTRPPRVPCGMLTGQFLTTVAERFERFAENAKSYEAGRRDMREEAGKEIEAGLQLDSAGFDLTGFIGSNGYLRAAAKRVRALPTEPLGGDD